MRALSYDQFKGPVTLEDVPDPTPNKDGVVLQVIASGLCLSDWHGWMGNDPDIKVPHVPGHELAGVIKAVGEDVTRWDVGDRVTLPFACGCGTCPQCKSGNQQVCDDQFQPGFTHWGSFAEFVAIDRADINLVSLPEGVDGITAAILGCRFATSFRAVVDQGRVSPGEWVAVHGCGGVGLSAIMIANALGANTIAIDVHDGKLDFARSIGAKVTINADDEDDVVQSVMDSTHGGAHVSIDALGSPTTCFNSISNLRKRGRHIQVGLMVDVYRFPPVPMDKIIAHELEVVGSHGMQAFRYEAMLEMILRGKLDPGKLIGRRIALEEAAVELVKMDSFNGVGVMVIDRFT